jgi:hypothetical protein
MKLISYIFVFIFFVITFSFSNNNLDFQKWKKNFKKIAINNNISEKTFDTVMSNTKFLPNVIKYDRYQPEFYEDTKTYITKRTSNKKVSKGVNFYNENKSLITFYLIIKNDLNDFQMSDPPMMLFIFLAGPMTVIPLFLYVRGVELCGLGSAGMIFYITPTFQFLLGFFYYEEVFSSTKLVSFIFIWIAVIIYIFEGFI